MFLDFLKLKKWVLYYMNIVIGMILLVYIYKKIDFWWYRFVICVFNRVLLWLGFYFDNYFIRI